MKLQLQAGDGLGAGVTGCPGSWHAHYEQTHGQLHSPNTHTQQNPTSNIHPAPRVCEGQTSKALTPWGEGLSDSILKHILLLSGPMLIPLVLLCSSLQTQLASPCPLRPSTPALWVPPSGPPSCSGPLHMLWDALGH